jgi:hypothetical protein
MAPHHEPPSALFALTVNCPHFYRAFLFSIRRAAHARGMMLSLFVSVIAAAAPPPVGVTRADELAAEAETAWTSGQFETALAGFRKSLALRRPESPGYSGILGSIAELERTLGHLREAERDARRALELRRRGFGPRITSPKCCGPGADTEPPKSCTAGLWQHSTAPARASWRSGPASSATWGRF